MRRNKGITLIALIITIIIMLILVAVSVNVLIKSNLLGAAEQATNKYKSATEEEGETGVIEINGKRYASIDDYINKNPMSTIDISLKTVYQNVAVTADGTKVKSIEHGVPIPVGYSYVTGEKDTGVVIQDDTTSDQFVWVPVLQNQKLELKISAKENLTDVKLFSPEGDEISIPSPSGNTYSVQVNPTRNGEYKVIAKTASETNTEYPYISSLFAQDFFETREMLAEEVKLEAEQEGITEEEVLLEWFPDIDPVTVENGYYYDNKIYTDNVGIQSEIVKACTNSVNKYGGFYIARYEAGSEAERKSGYIMDNSYVAMSQANKAPYDTITRADSIEKATAMGKDKTSVSACLISGAAWDRTLNWIVETNSNMSLNDINMDSTSWGNFVNSSFDFVGIYSSQNGDSYGYKEGTKEEDWSIVLGTGVTEYTKRNNIYDLAGNCDEWTTEGYGTDNFVYRGGMYYSAGYEYPASGRDYYYSKANALTFRAMLYINL